MIYLKPAKIFYSIFVLIIILNLPLYGQSQNGFYYPSLSPFKHFKHTAGLAGADLPEDMVEEASTLIRAPLFNYQALYYLPANFAVYGAFYTNFITYHFSLGPRWNYRFGKFSLAPGYDIAYWFGALNQFGYNSKLRGWIHYPNLTVGYDFDIFMLSLKAEIIYISSLTELADDIEITRKFKNYAGITFAVYIEQPLWKDHYLILGVKSNYTKFYYPVWAAFSTFDRFFWIPEFTVGFIL